MKKNILILLVAVMGAAFTFSSCAKFEEGPKFSFLSKKSRLANTWSVEKATSTSGSGTIDFTNQMTNYTLEIEKDGNYKVTYGNYTESGTWELNGDGDKISFTSSQANSTAESNDILKLKSKELWLRETESNGIVTEIHYVQK